MFREKLWEAVLAGVLVGNALALLCALLAMCAPFAAYPLMLLTATGGAILVWVGNAGLDVVIVTVTLGVPALISYWVFGDFRYGPLGAFVAGAVKGVLWHTVPHTWLDVSLLDAAVLITTPFVCCASARIARSQRARRQRSTCASQS